MHWSCYGLFGAPGYEPQRKAPCARRLRCFAATDWRRSALAANPKGACIFMLYVYLYIYIYIYVSVCVCMCMGFDVKGLLYNNFIYRKALKGLPYHNLVVYLWVYHEAFKGLPYHKFGIFA